MKNRFSKSKTQKVFTKKNSLNPAPRSPERSQASQDRPVRESSGPLFPKSWRPIVGTHAIREALQVHPSGLVQAWIKQGWESSTELRELEELFRSQKVKIEVKPEPLLHKLSQSHQGAALFSTWQPELDWNSLQQKETSKILVLDGIEDPHNLGAIIRTSWLMSVDAILIPQDRAVGLTATVHKVACGGAEHVPVVEVTNFSNILEDLKKLNFWVLGLSHKGKGTLFKQKLPAKVVWVIGAEDKGLRTATERACDELIGIPQVSAAASYNASVAAAIALSETYRQQQ
ncbi:MAG: 23S rRNA (guanosine(2251)-2'-O)-methyltransferase RlmB [Pseudobdellovibrionaceae bacterium]|jgi:23S rRNA (guanosine2251-2'-O)-methyltransferase